MIYGLIKQYTLNYDGSPQKLSHVFLNEAILGSLGKLGGPRV